MVYEHVIALLLPRLELYIVKCGRAMTPHCKNGDISRIDKMAHGSKYSVIYMISKTLRERG